MKTQLLAAAIGTAMMTGTAANAAEYIDLGGPATGSFYLWSAKNSPTQNGIEGKDSNGVFDPGHNGLPEYANFQIPAGETNAGVYTAIIAGPPNANAAEYKAVVDGFYGGGSDVTINNAITTDPAFSTLSAGQVTYDNSLVSGSGNSTIALTASNFNFNTFAWDGTVTPGQTGDSRSNFTGTPTDISPFSAIQTPYNDGSGAGNAQFYYVISVNDVTGTGLTFIDGELDSMDFVADIDVDLFVGPFASFGPATFSGTVTGNGLGYTFDVEGTEAAFVFSGLNLVGNRAGTASVVPEPTSLALLLAGGVLVTRRRRTA